MGNDLDAGEVVCPPRENPAIRERQPERVLPSPADVPVRGKGRGAACLNGIGEIDGTSRRREGVQRLQGRPRHHHQLLLQVVYAVCLRAADGERNEQKRRGERPSQCIQRPALRPQSPERRAHGNRHERGDKP